MVGSVEYDVAMELEMWKLTEEEKFQEHLKEREKTHMAKLGMCVVEREREREREREIERERERERLSLVHCRLEYKLQGQWLIILYKINVTHSMIS